MSDRCASVLEVMAPGRRKAIPYWKSIRQRKPMAKSDVDMNCLPSRLWPDCPSRRPQGPNYMRATPFASASKMAGRVLLAGDIPQL